MIPYHQIEQHNPSEGKYGDCLRTVIACLLEVEPHTVPHFAKLYKDEAPEVMWNEIDQWLIENHKLKIWMTCYNGENGLEQIMEGMNAWNENTYYILGGNTIDDIGHVVVCCNNHFVHNPAWNECRIVKPSANGAWVVITFVPALMIAPAGRSFE